MDGTTIGIDLGSYYGRIAAIINGTVSTIEINDDRALACIFSARSESWVTGNKATKTAPDNVIFDACRLQSGRDYSETWCYAKINNGSYANENKNALIQAISQQEVIKAILTTLIDAAEKRLQRQVMKAVITVPDYIDQHYRQVILRAGKLAKIENVFLISQNAAAATTYLLNKPNKTNSPSFFMIFNFGANQLAISVYKGIGNKAELVYAVHDKIGGEDFTTHLAEMFLNGVKSKEGNEFVANKKTLKYIREAAEKAKIDLSLMSRTESTLDVVGDNEHSYKVNTTRETLERCCETLFERIQMNIRKVLKDFQNGECISDIVMVGGSTRIFAIKGIIQKFLPSANFNSTLVPEEAIVYGAAINAAIMDGSVPFSVNVVAKAGHGIYCETEYAKIEIVKLNEQLPSTPRYFSYRKHIFKIEFFEEGDALQSLGFIRNIDGNGEIVCKVDDNGLLICSVNGKVIELILKPSVLNNDNSKSNREAISELHIDPPTIPKTEKKEIFQDTLKDSFDLNNSSQNLQSQPSYESSKSSKNEAIHQDKLMETKEKRENPGIYPNTLSGNPESILNSSSLGDPRSGPRSPIHNPQSSSGGSITQNDTKGANKPPTVNYKPSNIGHAYEKPIDSSNTTTYQQNSPTQMEPQRKSLFRKIDSKTYEVDIFATNPPLCVMLDMTNEFKQKNRCIRFWFSHNNFIARDSKTTVKLHFDISPRDMKPSDIIVHQFLSR